MSSLALKLMSRRDTVAFCCILFFLLAIYSLWLIALWPGILGEDSLAILLEVDQAGQFFSGKPAFWFFFVNTFYGATGRVELPIAIQLALAALVCARILAWCWMQRLYKTFVFLTFFTALSPRMLFASGSLYPDGPFAIATAAVLFELWLTLKRNRLSSASFSMLAIAMPFALFARANGIVMLIPLIYTLFRLRGRDRLKLGSIALAWCSLVTAGSVIHRSPAQHGALFPMVAYETVNFLQPRPMNLWTERPRISPRTMEIINRHTTVDALLRYYDRDYWDPLYHKPNGPRLGAMSDADKKGLIKEFFRYNLWENIPAFMGSRVNIFLVSALGRGGEVSINYSFHVLPQTQSNSVYRAMNTPKLTRWIGDLNNFSYRHRALLWTPFIGIFILFLFSRRAWLLRSTPDLSLAAPMLIQLTAIFLLSIAGEYRYLLPFFILPLAILPIFASGSTNIDLISK